MSKDKDDAKNSMPEESGVAIDVGTMNIVSARRIGKNVKTVRLRDAFLDLPMEHKKMLRLSKTSYVELDGKLLVIGDEALSTANLFNREARRPMAGGLLAAGETDAQQVMAIMIKQILGEPRKELEKCCYSVPAPALDVKDSDITYHTAMLKKILTELGYTPEPVNEAQAIVYSECLAENFSGLAISFGCLTPDTQIFTRDGLKPISEVVEGDYVLDRNGVYSRVQKTWSRDHVGDVYKISFFGNPDGVTLTGNHKVWVNRSQQWSWVTAEQLKNGDIIGEPIVRHSDASPILSFHEKHGNGPRTSRVIKWSVNACRFLGYFLADGHIGPKNRGTIYIDFGPNEQSYAEDVKKLVANLFKRSVSFIRHGKAIRCEFSHKSLQTWLRNYCYERINGGLTKKFPLRIEELNLSSIHGLIIGLVRGDGWLTKSEVKFGNSSKSLITAFHLLIGRMGLTSTITVRKEARSATLKDGRTISSRKPEWVVHVTGQDGIYLHNLISNFNDDGRSFVHQKVWTSHDFRCTQITCIESMKYSGKVHDITVDGDPSFSAPYITMHNSGMTNVCLSYNAMSALEFSVGRGGDWVDAGAARAVNTTAAKICSLKEIIANIANPNPESREEEAIALFIENLIDYTLTKIIQHFSQVRSEILIPKPIPLIVSGGSSLAKGFLNKFESRFEQYKAKFPIQISEIRAAQDPMTAVATGLLVVARMDD